ncbi:MAG: glycoside hydrolase family protein [Dysgonomonas sp.]|nr:glycoside hydrolase family protein [Dysgonomonas sp.]
MKLIMNSSLLLLLIIIGSLDMHSQTKGKADLPLSERLLPAPVNGGFEMPGYWVWGSSVIKGKDGKYHMFADRWKKELGFQSWVTASEVVHAVSDTPEGPYIFVDVALPKRGMEYFDGLATHNPRVIEYEGLYYLYYFGTTYDFPTPQSPDEWQDDYFEKAWMNKRIAIAYSESLDGPWIRPDKPAIEPRPGKWDSSITTNPSPMIDPRTNKIILIYKSSTGSPAPPLLLGVAQADKPLGEYKRLSDDPIFRFETNENKDNDIEDPFIWYNGEKYEMIMKDRFGHIAGEDGAGINATSTDAVNWELSEPVKVYSRYVRWDDGTTTHQANLERPFLLIEDGKPTHLFLATGEGDWPWNFKRTWNMVIPLK